MYYSFHTTSSFLSLLVSTLTAPHLSVLHCNFIIFLPFSSFFTNTIFLLSLHILALSYSIYLIIHIIHLLILYFYFILFFIVSASLSHVFVSFTLSCVPNNRVHCTLPSPFFYSFLPFHTSPSFSRLLWAEAQDQTRVRSWRSRQVMGSSANNTPWCSLTHTRRC